MKLDYLPKLLLQHDDSIFLEDPDLIKATKIFPLVATAHPTEPLIAIALGQRVVVINLQSDHPSFNDTTTPPESITALTWLTSTINTAIDSKDESTLSTTATTCLVAVTSEGYLQLHASDGRLLHRQELHHTAATSVYVRYSGNSLDPSDASEDVTVSFSNAIVRIPTYDIWPLVRWHQRARQGGGWWGGVTTGGALTGHPQLSPTKWDIRGTGKRSYSACVGPAPSTLYSMLTQYNGSSNNKLLVLSVGVEPPVASFVVEEGPGGGGILSLVSSLAVSSATEAFHRAKGFVPFASRFTSSSTQEPASNHLQSSPGRKRDKIAGISVRRDTDIWDDKRRRITHLSVSPCCRWAACCDTLGRVLLVDVAQFVIVRVFKGYRDAQVGWMILENRNDAILVIYAPRRGVIEAWKPLAGVRLGNVVIGGIGAHKGVLIVSSPVFNPNTRSRVPNKCWLFGIDTLELEDMTEEVRRVVFSNGSRGTTPLGKIRASPSRPASGGSIVIQ